MLTDQNYAVVEAALTEGTMPTDSRSIVTVSYTHLLEGFEGFHFHQLRHTYTSNLLANGAAPKDVQELLGHSDAVSYTHLDVYKRQER